MSQSIGNKPNPPLVVKEIPDIYVRNNFFELSKYFENQNQLLNFKFIEFKTDSAVSNLKVPHGLGFLPKDIVRAKVTGTGICTFNHSLFDKQLLDVSTTGPVRVRCFVGTHFRDASQVNPTEADSEDFFSKLPTIPGKNGAIKFIEQSLGYEVQTTDDTIFVKSSNGVSSVPITLPDAKLNSGRQVTLIKNDDDFLQHTISGTNNQTIDGKISKTLATFRERWVLLSNGTNWTVIVHDYPKDWTQYTPTCSGFTITAGSSVVRWRRIGANIELQALIAVASVAASEARLFFPTVGTSTIQAITSVLPSAAPYLRVGDMGYSLIANVSYNVLAPRSAAFINFSYDGAAGLTPQNGNVVFAANPYSFDASVPIQGWEG